MMEGISSEAASLAGHLQAVQPVLDLRLEPGHDRGPHRHRLHRGRRRPLHRLRLERDHRGRRQRPRRGGPGAALVPGRARAAHADRWCTATSATAPRSRTRRRRTASRWAPTRSGPPSASSACPRTRLLRARRGLRPVRGGHRRARPGRRATAWEAMLAAVPRRLPGAGGRDRPDAAPRRCPAAGRPSCPTFPPDAKGLATRDSSGQVLNAVAQRVPWLLGGSADLSPVDQDPPGRSTAPATSSPTTGTAATCTSASASTRRRRSPTGWP